MAITIVKKIEEYNLEKLQTKLIKICFPLFKCSSITYFQYDKSFTDRSRITLSTNASWIYQYYNSEYYKNGMHHKDIHTYESGYNIWNSVGRSCVIDLARNKFEIDNGFTIIERSYNCCEFYHFASRLGNDGIINFYLNYLNLLRRFIAYFKCESRELIECTLKNKIKYIVDDEDYTTNKDHIDLNNLFNRTRFSRFYFDIKGAQQYLTEQELNISKWLIQGKGAKEIGLILEISPRTVETHIASIKDKLNCYKQTGIVHKLLSIGIDKVIDIN